MTIRPNMQRKNCLIFCKSKTSEIDLIFILKFFKICPKTSFIVIVVFYKKCTKFANLCDKKSPILLGFYANIRLDLSLFCNITGAHLKDKNLSHC